jgi:hypothetical protein
LTSGLGSNFGNKNNNSPYYAKKGEPMYQKNMDSDDDGVISFDEFREYCKSNGISTSDMKKMLEMLKNNDGLTLKNNKPITYKTGWQVADHGVECKTIAEASKAIEEMQGNCGVWFSDGVYYIDHSFRVKTKKEALTIGRKYNQISVLRWSDMRLVYC